MKRYSLKSIKIKTTYPCEKISPQESGSHITVGLKLNKNQAIDLARALLIAAQDWNQIDLMASKKDNRIRITEQRKD